MPDRYFVSPDGVDEPTIWEAADGDPAVLFRRAELPGPRAELLWSILRGALTADEETVERVARQLHETRHNGKFPGWVYVRDDIRDFYREMARDALAALRGEQ